MARSIEADRDVEAVLALGVKKILSKRESALALFETLKKEGDRFEVPELDLASSLKEKNIAGIRTFVVNEEAMSDDGNVIVFLAGGAYIMGPGVNQFNFSDAMSRELNCPVYLPLYPKATYSNYEECYDKMLGFYKELLEITDAKHIILSGDSAGEGLALGLTQWLKELGLPLPGQLALISPWLDLMTDNPLIHAGVYEEEDAMLALPGLRVCAEKWAGDTADMHYYRLSPMFGSLEGLPPVIMYYGGYEIFCPDLRRFREIAEAAGMDLIAHEWPEMIHCFIIHPIPEAKEAQKQLVEEIKANFHD